MYFAPTAASAVALELPQRGADIVITYVSNATAAESVVEQIRALGARAIALKADVSQEEEVKPMFETLHREFGRLDIAVSNSGIEHFGVLSEVRGSDIDAIFAVNVKNQYLVA
ncbi:Short-chain dehydrogenase/reductase SDR [Penicillium mononematosum]|uniref:Short-chain dehydrogenase/reductase SDR n=1 Tax=Penicillium mononematosum TaxID=268346 RepID=UPI0025480D4C|nr:Short-chain dehydrogenase/reductase SDR [Penicillium mononematosum]KAJ6185573.1 Short-chain dehydrogenase/reductase SDR [Penicillium mononematosum]